MEMLIVKIQYEFSATWVDCAVEISDYLNNLEDVVAYSLDHQKAEVIRDIMLVIPEVTNEKNHSEKRKLLKEKGLIM